MLPTNYEIDIIPAVIVAVIAVIVIGAIKLFIILCEFESRRYMKEFEQIFKDDKGSK